MKKVIIELDESRRLEIESIVKYDKRYRVRDRANAVLYKSKEYEVKEIAKILDVRGETVYGWLQNYKKDGIESLYDKKGTGRKPAITEEQKEVIRELALNGVSIPSINAKVREQLNIHVHDETLRRLLKKNKL